MNLNIVCIPGDGIRPEIITEAKRVLNRISEKFGITSPIMPQEKDRNQPVKQVGTVDMGKQIAERA